MAYLRVISVICPELPMAFGAELCCAHEGPGTHLGRACEEVVLNAHEDLEDMWNVTRHVLSRRGLDTLR